MIEKIYNLYFIEWGFRNKILKQVPLFIRISYTFLFIALAIISNIIIYKKSLFIFNFYVSISIVIFLFLYAFIYIKFLIPNFLKSNIEFKNIHEYIEIRKSIFELYLKDGIKLFSNDKKYKQALEILDDKIADAKAPYYINKSVIIGIFTPIWIQYISFLFQKTLHTWYDATALFFALVIWISVLLYFYYSLKMIYIDITNDRYKNLKLLKLKIQELYLENL